MPDSTVAVDDYSASYAALGITSDTNWETLRVRYQRLISQWHPDRFSDDPAAKNVAEERSKEIIAAYQVLGKYRQEHGVLPPLNPIKDSVAQEPWGDTAPASNGVAFDARAAATAVDTGGGPQASRSKAKYWRRIGLVAFIAFPAVFFADRYTTQRAPDGGAPDNPTRPEPAETAPPETARAQHGAGWIWIGSTVGDVYGAQGIPTSTEGETWHYGKSEVRFVQGRVVSWNQHPDNPLRIARNQPVQVREGTFDIGSSKNEVLAVQGMPVTETDTIWDYGLSRVYFKDNRVVRWQESPMQLLHIPH
jgi:hypothetical protein